MTVAEQQPPKIEFPCDDYVIKVVGDVAPGFRAFVHSVLVQYDASIREDAFRITPSRNGRFESLTVSLRIEREEHLSDLHQTLKADDRVKMVL